MLGTPKMNRMLSSKSLYSAITCIFCVALFVNYHSWGPANIRPLYAPHQDCSPAPASNKTPVATTIVPPSSESLSTIPEKIWYKLGPKDLSSDSKKWIGDCFAKNPTYKFEFMTDDTSDLYVQKYFASRPEIIEVYRNIPIPILKADFLRYLILYNEGGLWSDLDVSCEDVPMRKWIPEQYKDKTAVVVGLEYDWEWKNDNFLHSQFASWTIMAKPKSPHMLMIINDILEDFNQKLKENDVTLPNLKLEMVGHVVDITGPKRMTRGIIRSLEMILKDTVDDRNISGLTSPKLIGDVLILPGNAFGALQTGYPKNQGPPLVTHHYAGSWKNEKGGETG